MEETNDGHVWVLNNRTFCRLKNAVNELNAAMHDLPDTMEMELDGLGILTVRLKSVILGGI